MSSIYDEDIKKIKNILSTRSATVASASYNGPYSVAVYGVGFEDSEVDKTIPTVTTTYTPLPYGTEAELRKEIEELEEELEEKNERIEKLEANQKFFIERDNEFSSRCKLLEAENKYLNKMLAVIRSAVEDLD